MPATIPDWQKSPTVGRPATMRDAPPAPTIDLAGPMTAGQGERVIALLEDIKRELAGMKSAVRLMAGTL